MKKLCEIREETIIKTIREKLSMDDQHQLRLSLQ